MIAKARQSTAVELDRGTLDRGFWRWRDRVHWAVPLILVLLGLALRFWSLDGNSLDHDEIWSYEAASLSWPDLFDRIVRDISHPILSYIPIKLALMAGNGSVWSVRLVSLIEGAGTLFATWGLCEALKLRLRETALALFLVAVNGYFIEYAQYLRNFALLQALSVLSLWLFVRALDPKRPITPAFIALTLANILLVHSHYWGWFFIAIEGLWVLAMARHRLAAMVLSAAATLLAFAPWVYLVAHAAHERGDATNQISWMERPLYMDLVWLIDRMNGPLAIPKAALVGLLLFGLPVAAWLVKLVIDRRPERLTVPLLLIAFWALPIGITFWVSHSLDRPVWGARHLIIAAVPYLILVSLSANRLIEGRGRMLLPLALALWAGSASVTTLASAGDRSFAWDAVIARIRQQDGAGPDPIRLFSAEGFVTHPAEFYAARLDGRPIAVTTDEAFRTADGSHFWVLYRQELWHDDQTPKARLEARGFHVGDGFVARSRFQTLVVLPVDR